MNKAQIAQMISDLKGQILQLELALVSGEDMQGEDMQVEEPMDEAAPQAIRTMPKEEDEESGMALLAKKKPLPPAIVRRAAGMGY
jgi:hypothetical protein